MSISNTHRTSVRNVSDSSDWCPKKTQFFLYLETPWTRVRLLQDTRKTRIGQMSPKINFYLLILSLDIYQTYARVIETTILINEGLKALYFYYNIFRFF
jgi:hypothetical protein